MPSFIPGLILSFAFYFITQVVMIDGRSGLEALKASYRFVEANLSDCLIVVLASLAISAVLHSVPVIGPLLGLISHFISMLWPHCFTSIAAQTGRVHKRRRARGWRLSEGKIRMPIRAETAANPCFNHYL